MTVQVSINTDDFVRLIRSLKEKAQRTDQAIVRTINQVGNHLLEQVVDSVSAQTGMEPEVARRLVKVRRASIGDMSFRINAEEAMTTGLDRNRPSLRERGFLRRPDEFFHQDEMVNIVTMEDEAVCPICQEASEEGPYPIEEARRMIPLHPNCRCVVQSARRRRTLPVEFRRGRDVEVSRMTMTDLVSALKRDLKIVLRAK